MLPANQSWPYDIISCEELCSGNGLSPVRHQSIVGTSTELFSVGPSVPDGGMIINITQFTSWKMHLKMSYAKCRPFFQLRSVNVYVLLKMILYTIQTHIDNTHVSNVTSVDKEHNLPLPISVSSRWHRNVDIWSIDTIDNVSMRRYVMIRKCMVRSGRRLFKSLWPSDAIWRHRSGSALVQVMACYLTASSHYLNQCWLIISYFQWQSPVGNLTKPQSSIT